MLMGIVLTVIITVTSIVPVSAANITTTATGYTSASDVKYQYHGDYISNWGARGEVATFLSPNAEKFYTGSYTYDVLSDKQGGSSQSTAPSSALYKALQSMMVAEHSHETSYGETRDQYKYTDCERNDVAHISSFYSGTELNGAWGSSPSWNREHTWPNSKGLELGDEDDIMMLRPTATSENSDRGNKAYGEGAGYYHPNNEANGKYDLRGDCARIFLYVYVRWGNVNGNGDPRYATWGTNGVMESMDVLLRWMEEDPVDTWEMGRNDAVESITGTRNVFVDYPEYAWLLFGEEIPNDMTTPSGIAKDGDNGGNSGSDTPINPPTPSCTHSNTRLGHKKAATCTKEGYTGDLECEDCGAVVKAGTKIPATGHKNTEVKGAIEATCSKEGYTGDTYCKDCGTKLQSGTTIAAGAHNTELQGVKDATCTEDGYNGDIVCKDCGITVQEGQIVTAPGHHTFGDWVVVKEATATTDGSKERSCSVCAHKETETIPATGTGDEPGSETESEEPSSTEPESKPGESENQNTQTGKPGNDSADKNDSVDPIVVAVAVAIPCVCAVGGISAVVIKRKTSK